MTLSPTFNQSQIRVAWHLAAISALICGLVVVFLFMRYHQRMLPNIFIDNLPVSGLTALETRELLQSQTTMPKKQTLTIRVGKTIMATSSDKLAVNRQIDLAIEQAFAVGRQGPIWKRALSFINTFFSQHAFTTKLAYQRESLANLINDLATQIDYSGQEPQVVLPQSGNARSLIIKPGFFGRKLNRVATKAAINHALNQGRYEVEVVVASTAGELSDEEIIAAKKRAARFVGKKIILSDQDQWVSLNDKKLVKLLAFPSGINEQFLNELLTDWQAKFYRQAREPVFAYDSQSLRVSKFVPPQDGTKLAVKATRDNLLKAIEKIDTNNTEDTQKINLALEHSPPHKSLAETNSLGIKERIGLGISQYAHSIPNRIHNVALTTNKISLTLIPPGQEFSFNKTLGDVSAKTGFRSAYVIKNGQTELGDGGGVCQVSTTLFRAVLNAGLKIIRRIPHSYRVSYYELDNKPGIDATVYAGEIDFRFINDTDHYILIYGEADSDNLAMKIEIYGTSDGRTSEIVDHTTWNPRPPLPAQYIPTTTLPPGKLRQVDWSAPGISAKFTNIVKDKNGKLLSKNTYTSVYRPWAAKYLKGI